MSWKAADIKAEVDAMAMLLQARPGVSGLEQRLLNALKAKLQQMSVQSPAEWVKCYDAVKESKLPPAVAAEIHGLLDQLAAGPMQHTAAKVTNVAQECRSIHLYLTSADLAALEASSMWEGALVLTSRMRKLGIKGLKESLKKLCTTILVHFDFQRTQKIPSADTTYDVACHLVTKMQTSMVEIPPNAISLAVYPDDPLLLASSHLDAAYGQEKPAKKDFPNLHVLMKNHVWVRNSAAAISGKAGVD